MKRLVAVLALAVSTSITADAGSDKPYFHAVVRELNTLAASHALVGDYTIRETRQTYRLMYYEVVGHSKECRITFFRRAVPDGPEFEPVPIFFRGARSVELTWRETAGKGSPLIFDNKVGVVYATTGIIIPADDEETGVRLKELLLRIWKSCR